VYCLTEDGFDAAKSATGPNGAYIEAEAVWREPPSGDPRAVVRDLHVNGWVMALQLAAPGAVRGWRGPGASKLVPPRRRDRGEWIDLRPADIQLAGTRRLRDHGLDQLLPVNPAATLEIRLKRPDQALRFDVLLEFDRSRGAAYNEDKLRRYDLLVSGWHRLLDRYRTLGSPPVVLFLCEDERQALAYIRTADRTVTTRVAEAGTPEVEWPCPGRAGILFAVERDVHLGSLEVLALPELPPEIRTKLHGKSAAKCQPRRLALIDPKTPARAR